MKKTVLRKLFKEKRHELSPDLFERLSLSLFKNVCQQFDFNSKNIHLFLPIAEQREINTYELKSQIELRFKDIQWVISKSNFSDQTLTHFLWKPQTIIRKNKWGIPEPVGAKPFSIKDLDYIFVPLLVADEHGNRVGYGKGFYDRFLSQCTAKKIGLSLFEPIKQIETKEFDVPLNFVASPQQVLTVSKNTEQGEEVL